MKRKIHRCRYYCMKHTMQGTLNIKASWELILPTLSSWQFVAIWFWSTVSTRGSIKACFLMQLMSNPYTLFQTDMENENIINKKIKYTWWHKYHLCSNKTRNFKVFNNSSHSQFLNSVFGMRQEICMSVWQANKYWFGHLFMYKRLIIIFSKRSKAHTQFYLLCNLYLQWR